MKRTEQGTPGRSTRARAAVAVAVDDGPSRKIPRCRQWQRKKQDYTLLQGRRPPQHRFLSCAQQRQSHDLRSLFALARVAASVRLLHRPIVQLVCLSAERPRPTSWPSPTSQHLHINLVKCSGSTKAVFCASPSTCSSMVTGTRGMRYNTCVVGPRQRRTVLGDPLPAMLHASILCGRKTSCPPQRRTPRHPNDRGRAQHSKVLTM